MITNTKKQIAALIDLDGVTIDTESQYSVFWKAIGEKYQLGIENFEQLAKGRTPPDVVSQYFSHLPKEEQKEIVRENQVFDTKLEIIPIEGVLDFLAELKKAKVPTGLVTSSDNAKLTFVFEKLPIKHLFDTIVSGDCITSGKPNPMCYLLAAKNLGIEPQNCIVFEDSRSGIKAGNAANMRVIGLSTTLPADSIKDDCIKVIPNFLNFRFPF